VGHDGVQEEAREGEGQGEGQENFGVFITEIANSVDSIRTYFGGCPL